MSNTAPRYTEDCTVRDSSTIWSDDAGRIHILVGGTETVYKMDADTALDLAGHLLDFAIGKLRDEAKGATSRGDYYKDRAEEAEQRADALQAQLDKITEGY